MPTPQQMALARGLDPQAVASLQGLRRNTQNTGSALAPPPMPASFNAPRPPPMGGGGMPPPMPSAAPPFDAGAFRAGLPQVPRGPFGDPGIYGGMPTPMGQVPADWPAGRPPPPGAPPVGAPPGGVQMPGWPAPPAQGQPINPQTGLPYPGNVDPWPGAVDPWQGPRPSQPVGPQPLGPGQLLPPRGPGNIPY